MNPKRDPRASYQLFPKKDQVLQQSSTKVEIPSYLPIPSKLSVVIYRKRLFVKSIPDRYQHLRMFIFGFMIKGYSDSSSRELLDIIKRIIQGTTHRQATDSKITKLIKRMDQIPYDKGSDTQNQIISLFTQSTDTLIINSFVQFIQKQGSDYYQMLQCRNWFQSQFGQKIKLLDHYQSPSNQITFLKDGDKILYQSQNDVDNIEGMSLGSNLLTKSQMMAGVSKTDTQQNENDVLELSIMKPSIHGVSDSMPSPGIIHKFSVNSNYSPLPEGVEEEDEGGESGRKGKSGVDGKGKGKDKGFNLWDYLCC